MLVTGQPDLPVLHRVQLRIVPPQSPNRPRTTPLGRTPRQTLVSHPPKIGDTPPKPGHPSRPARPATGTASDRDGQRQGRPATGTASDRDGQRQGRPATGTA